MDVSLSKLLERVKDMETWSAAVHGLANSWDNLVNEKQQQRTAAFFFQFHYNIIYGMPTTY